MPEVLSPGVSGRGVKLTTHLHLVSRCVRGAICPLPQYVLMPCCLIKQIRLHGVVFNKHTDTCAFIFGYSMTPY